MTNKNNKYWFMTAVNHMQTIYNAVNHVKTWSHFQVITVAGHSSMHLACIRTRQVLKPPKYRRDLKLDLCLYLDPLLCLYCIDY